jgi:CubicO group peptidase (beta-lactamase class C family)
MTSMQDALGGIDRWVDDGAVRGVAAAVWHHGEIVASHAAGDAAPGRRVRPDTIFALASVSKPISVAGIMLVLHRHGVSLDTPLVDVLPEFAEVDDPFDPDLLPQLEAQRDRVTLRQALSHTSGLPENVGVRRLRMSSLPSHDEIVDAMLNVPLQSAPGEELRYSNVGIGLAGRAAARLEGRDIHTIVRTEIVGAMSLDGIVLRPGPELDHRIAQVDDAAGKGSAHESYNSAYWRDLAITWGGYYATVPDALRFAISFLRGRESPLPEAASAEMVIDQTGGVPGGVDSAGIHWHHGAWGLGWEVKGHKRHHWTGTLTSERTWCHWGQAGTLVWVDPEREMGMAVFGNRTVATAWPLRPPRWAELSDAVVTAMEKRS